MVACPQCNETKFRRTATGAVLDQYRCDKGHTFERISPSIKRWAIIGGVTVLTGGLDAGAIGTFVAGIFDVAGS